MSQSNSESDIWDYKSLQKTKRQVTSPDTGGHGAKRAKQPKQEKFKNKSTKPTKSETQITSQNKSDSHPGHNKDPDAESRGHWCPVCQMPFTILLVQSTQWHVAECLETPGENNKGQYLYFFIY